ncbi:hypothetical protein F2P81_005383 [Scophthalmus maximus]|uniref:Uncharacterized protein n=1 Tax=Scophthalmus maximus TaxID=52904 RepID=A0A6A4TG59_SCOMX|nr:hypothetical protein F2P81_005383 [Scophthalmus maximus]
MLTSLAANFNIGHDNHTVWWEDESGPKVYHLQLYQNGNDAALLAFPLAHISNSKWGPKLPKSGFGAFGRIRTSAGLFGPLLADVALLVAQNRLTACSYASLARLPCGDLGRRTMRSYTSEPSYGDSRSRLAANVSQPMSRRPDA